MLNEVLERIGRITRNVDVRAISQSVVGEKLQQLKTEGYVAFDHLVGSERLEALQIDYKRRLEQDLAFETPVLAQSRIDAVRDKDLIASNFLEKPQALAARGLTFDRSEVESYQQAVETFRPSTLTLPLPDTQMWFDLWLDSEVLPVIEGYMGFVPNLVEAYIRRNYPSDFTIMNHAWHRDSNHPRHLLKAFFFLSDCTLKTGPHHYISGSVEDRRLDGGGYFTQAEVEKLYPPESGREVVSVVPAGTIILEDTRGLHKAGIPMEGYRDLGYATFLPPIALRKRPALFKIGGGTFSALSDRQKRYLPSEVLTEI